MICALRCEQKVTRHHVPKLEVVTLETSEGRRNVDDGASVLVILGVLRRRHVLVEMKNVDAMLNQLGNG